MDNRKIRDWATGGIRIGPTGHRRIGLTGWRNCKGNREEEERLGNKKEVAPLA